LIAPQATMSSKASEGKKSDTAGTAEDDVEMQEASRMATTFFERLERYEQQELLCWASSNWLLSPEFKLPIEHPLGIVTSAKLADPALHFVLLPVPDMPHAPLDFKEVHQIIRELTIGIFGCNQWPQLALETNYDQASSVQLPPAYVDTKIGQTMLAVDCAIKSLWHGCHMVREKRVKFAERWRSTLAVNSATGKPETLKVILNEFVAAGLTDVTKEEGWESVYADLPVEDPNDPKLAKDRKAFTDLADCMRMCLTMKQRSVLSYKNMSFVDADWTVMSQILLTEEEIDEEGYELLNSRLQRQAEAIQAHLDRNEHSHRNLLLLKLASFLIPFFIGIKRRMRIPDLSALLSPLIGDDVKTERELPPTIVSPEFCCRNFSFPPNQYFSLHGGVSFEIETPQPTSLAADREISRPLYEQIEREAADIRARAGPDAPPLEHYPVGTVEIDMRRYYVIPIQLETFYPQQPQKPKWVRAMYEEMARAMQQKKLPMQEAQLFDQFKKFFGQKKAIKCHKNLPGMKLCAQRGLQSMFFSLYRKHKNELNKQDESGLSLIHHAAVHNKPHIVTFLLHNSMDVNVRRHNTILSTGERNRTGPTALHLASRCGSLEVASCLLASYANVIVTDAMGWAAVHHAAYFNHPNVLRLMIRKHEELLELLTKNSLRSTPTLLAATSGALQSLLTLFELGSNRAWHDEEGNGVIELATINLHTNILKQLIQSPYEDLPVWPTLVEMLASNRLEHMCSAVKCLICLSVSHDTHWRCILEAGGVSALVRLLSLSSESLELVRDTTSVLRNISDHDRVKSALADANAAPILIQLLSSGTAQILANTSLVLSDMACIDESRALISELGGLAPLVAVLDSPAEDVRSNAVNALRVLCTGNSANQLRVAECGAVPPLVQFLAAGASEILQTNAAAALAAITKRNPDNQELVLKAKAVEPLVNLLKSRGNINVQVKAASAVEALSEGNPMSQKAFIRLETDKALLKLLKVWSLEVKEQGALALWALAGATHVQQRAIAERIGIQQLIEILMTKSEKLQFVACVALTALARDSVTRQNEVAKEGGLQPLVRIMKSPKSSQRVLLYAVQCLAALCVGVAHSNNPATQSRLAEEGAIELLTELLANSPVPEVQAEAAYSLGCLVLRNGDNQLQLKQLPQFSYSLLLALLDAETPKIRLRGCQALAVFAFNNTRQQFAIREAGGISIAALEEFLASSDPAARCHAAFQSVVLTRDIVYADPVSLTAKGIQILVGLLKTPRSSSALPVSQQQSAAAAEELVETACAYLASLAHSRSGLKDAIITAGGLDRLVRLLLDSDSRTVRSAASVVLGYLTFNRTAARLLLKACRENPGLFYKLEAALPLPDARICDEFLADFRAAEKIGLPCQFMEVNGGHPILPSRAATAKARARPPTSVGQAAGPSSSTASAAQQQKMLRSKSAPAHRLIRPGSNKR
ncbi:hypothetical protein BOX15_Mlig007209g2, partial [Macrostomum lignano]